MASNAENKDKDFSLFLSLAYAGMMASLGLLLGMLYLLSFPLKGYASLQERDKALEGRETQAPSPADAFYLEGPTLRNRTWEAKRGQLIQGGAPSVTLTPGEINAWFEAKFRPGKSAKDTETTGLSLEPDIPNLGLSEAGVVYLNLPSKISGYGLDGDYVLSAQVQFTPGPGPGLVVDRMQIGGAVVPLPEVLGARLISAIMASYSQTEEYSALNKAWDRVQTVEIAPDGLILKFAAP